MTVCFLAPLQILTLKMPIKTTSENVVCWIFLQTYFCIQANSVDPDQTAPRWAVWSGSTLFAKMTFKITSRGQSRWQLLWLAVIRVDTNNSDNFLHVCCFTTGWLGKVNQFRSWLNVFLQAACSGPLIQAMFYEPHSLISLCPPVEALESLTIWLMS